MVELLVFTRDAVCFEIRESVRVFILVLTVRARQFREKHSHIFQTEAVRFEILYMHLCVAFERIA